MRFRIRPHRQALRDISGLPTQIQVRISRRIDELADTPRPPDSRQLKGRLGFLRRLRVGNYRVAFSVDDEAAEVIIWRVGHRDKFYDLLERGV